MRKYISAVVSAIITFALIYIGIPALAVVFLVAMLITAVELWAAKGAALYTTIGAVVGFVVCALFFGVNTGIG